MASFYIPLTGLDADSTALNTIANNLANMNTTGFKAQTANFSDLFYQQIGATGSGDPIQTGSGTQVAAIATDFSNGSPTSTNVATDVALQGNGFFVVSNGNSQYLTRAGDFSIDSKGNLVTSNGLNVMGYPAVNGVVNTNAPLAPINIPEAAILSPKATTSFNMTANLDSAGANQTFPATLNIYDSLGQMHTATVTYTQTGINAWNYSIALPAGDFTGGVSAPVTGNMKFDASGNLSQVNGTAVGPGAGQVSSIPVAFAGLADQSNNLNMTWNLMGAAGTPTISQVAAGSAVSATTQDGYTSGQYRGFTIGADGTVTVTYSNEQKLNVGQIALGNVANLQGLQAEGDGDYATTLASGNAAIGASGSAGLGTMQDGAIEASNVNISAEFSDLIIAQRAFEANSKSITTFDTITQETIQMIH
ncbi:MAG TPA: flagellar hook protein FlgE [Terracidiphilus sp.]|jgi:flagellar hook protein FlgE|nr:flagellar hook protein FlgE [Terracidiphilus sp.]